MVGVSGQKKNTKNHKVLNWETFLIDFHEIYIQLDVFDFPT